MKWIKVVIQGRELSVGFDENSIHIYNAFPIKDDLKMRGYRWDPADKSWFINPAEMEKELEVLKNDLREPEVVPVPAGPAGVAPFPRSCSVIELRNRIDRLIQEGIRGNIWIRGVVASEIKNYQWASYFDLKDEQEQSDVFFRVEVRKNDMSRINRVLSETGVAEGVEKDLPIFCLVEVHLSLRNVVDVRLTLRDILPEFTQAKIRNQRDITLEKLRAQGILENQKKLSLPVLVSRIGLITSEQGTSVRDIMAGLGSIRDCYDFIFLDTRMEGTSVVTSLRDALDLLEERFGDRLDMIIIARGGGSEQSLSVFNDYLLCQRICQARIPVVTAIGHEKDMSAAELCSHLTPTPSTPSGVGQFLRDRFVDLQNSLVEMIDQVSRFFLLSHNREMEKLSAAVQGIPDQAVRIYRSRREGLSNLLKRFEQAARLMVRNQERSLMVLLQGISLKNQMVQKGAHTAVSRVTELILSRSGLSNRGTEKQLARTLSRLDFRKRMRENRNSLTSVADQVTEMILRSKRVIQNSETALKSLQQLIAASDPHRILKRGFTLTLDEQNRVVSTLKQFKRITRARLRFQDGLSGFLKEEEK